MKKLAIIIDSFTGLNKKEIEEFKDVYYLPQKIILDNKEYTIGIENEKKELIQLSNEAIDVKTSQPSPQKVIELFEKLSKKYENIIFMPISQVLSGTFQTAKNFAKDFKNIKVIEQVFVGNTALLFGLKAIDLINKNEKTIEEIEKWLEEEGSAFYNFVIPKTNDAFIRGGRIGKTTALILSKLKLVPIIKFEKGKKLHKASIKKSGKKAISWAIEQIEKNIPKEKQEKWEWLICHSLDEQYVKIAKNILKSKNYKNINAQLINALINAQTGNGAISIGIRKKISI